MDTLNVTESSSLEKEEKSVGCCKGSIATEALYLNGELKFFPPVYRQRYEAVLSTLQQSPWGDTLKKVVDFGCAELGFFLYLKNMLGAEEILEIDIDEKVLERGISRATPLNSDYLLCKREKPMNVYVLTGNIAEYDDCLSGTDAVVAIEVIEHLHPEELDKVPENIFYNIRPKIAVFTTPNADFNVLFPNMTNFRHFDHKFEWSRKEFAQWTQKMIEKYPYYSVKIHGIGAGPTGSENLGCCSQMAVFTRIVGSKDEPPNLQVKGGNNYKLIRKFEYPFFVDNRTKEMKILDEVLYRIMFTMDNAQYYNYEDCCSEIPLPDIFQYVSKWCDSQQQLKQILLNHGFYIKEKDGSDIFVHFGHESDRNPSPEDRESSGEFNIPECAPKVDLVTEDWDTD